jgi:hypothetical protein
MGHSLEVCGAFSISSSTEGRAEEARSRAIEPVARRKEMTFSSLGWPGGVRPAVSQMCRPTSLEPVKAMKSICGEAMSRLPTS